MKGWRRLVAALVAVLALYGFVIIRSAQHLQQARTLSAEGLSIEAAREYQTAIGYHAPLNPYCRRAGVELLAMAEEETLLRADLEDRLQRSLRGTRSFYQPHADLLTSANHLHDPSIVGFILSLMVLIAAFATGLWTGVSAGRRWLTVVLLGSLWALVLGLA